MIEESASDFEPILVQQVDIVRKEASRLEKVGTRTYT